MTCASEGQVSVWGCRCGSHGAGGSEEPCPGANQEARAERGPLPHTSVQGHEEQCCLETPATAWVPAVASSHGRHLSCCAAWLSLEGLSHPPAACACPPAQHAHPCWWQKEVFHCLEKTVLSIFFLQETPAGKSGSSLQTPAWPPGQQKPPRASGLAQDSGAVWGIWA